MTLQTTIEERFVNRDGLVAIVSVRRRRRWPFLDGRVRVHLKNGHRLVGELMINEVLFEEACRQMGPLGFFQPFTAKGCPYVDEREKATW